MLRPRDCGDEIYMFSCWNRIVCLAQFRAGCVDVGGITQDGMRLQCMDRNWDLSTADH